MKKINFLMLLALVFLLSCRTDQFPEKESYNNTSAFQLTSKRISLNESKHKTKLIPELEQVENKFKSFSKNNAQGKVVSYANGVSIDTEDVIYIENGSDYYTYTFHINRENAPANAPVENLLLSPLPDGTYREFLLTYNFTPAEKQILRSGGFVDTKDKVVVTELISGTYSAGFAKISCSYQTVTFNMPCASNDQHMPGQRCEMTGNDAPKSYTMITLVCGNDLTTDVGTYPGEGGGAGPGSGEVGGGVPTQPVTVSSFPIFVKKLPIELKNMINAPENKDFSDLLRSYYEANYESDEAKNFIEWAVKFRLNNLDITLEQFHPMFTFAHNFLQENPDTINPDQIFQRIKDLDDALIQNHNLLIDIPCSELDDWQAVAMHQVPTSVKSKLQNIKNQTGWWNSWETTDLDQGAGTGINMDLFPITINSLPNKPNTNVKYTPAEFFDFFRKNINLFAEKFTPIEDNYYNIHDTALWNSTNPLGALLHIDINPDDGTVICSGFNSNTWIFTTIKAPFGYAYDGVHPVTGNRVFSYHIDNNGRMIIYTRGVDRVTKKAPFNSSISAIVNYAAESAAFSGADNLWEKMQEKLSKHINDNGGNASIIEAKKYRPNYSKVKSYLKNQATLQSLGCN